MGVPNLTHETLRPVPVGGNDGAVNQQLCRRQVAENPSVELESKSGDKRYHIYFNLIISATAACDTFHAYLFTIHVEQIERTQPRVIVLRP